MQIEEIHFGLDITTLFCGDGWEDVDESASAARYAEQLKDRIQRAYPSARVYIEQEPRTRGWCIPSEHQDTVLAECSEIDEQLFNEIDAWVIEEESR